MSKGKSTKYRIVDTALDQAIYKGLENVTFGSLSKALKMSKSGLFAHFTSKEDLQLKVLDRAVSLFMQNVVVPAHSKAEGIEQLKALLENFLTWIDGGYELPGCPFVGLVQEYDDRSGAIQDAIRRSEESWRSLLASNIKTSQRMGQIKREDEDEQIVFELIGAALSFQISRKFLNDVKAADRTRRAWADSLK